MKRNPNGASTEFRFWTFVCAEPNTGCWLWTGALKNNGYGAFTRSPNEAGSKNMYAHRYAYELLVGKIPKDREIDHKCRIKCCVNPAHLRVATRLENMAHRYSIYVSCKRGHPLSTRTSGKRYCRMCHAEREVVRRKFRKRAHQSAEDALGIGS